jgi:hypothetical protein
MKNGGLAMKELPMSSANESDHECWEYRHRSIDSAEANVRAAACQEQDAEFIEWLIVTLEGLESAEEGWRMVRAKIESDDGGRI